MAALMGAPRVGVGAEAEMMTADTHAATEIAQMKADAEMETFIEEVVGTARALEALIDIIDLEVDVIETIPRALVSREMRDAIVDQAEAPNESPHPH